MAHAYKNRGEVVEAVAQVITRWDFTPLINHPDVAAEDFFFFFGKLNWSTTMCSLQAPQCILWF